MTTKLKVIRSLSAKLQRQAELAKELERSMYLQSIHPTIYDKGTVTSTVVSKHMTGNSKSEKEIVQCYFLDGRGNKFHISRNQCVELFPDKVVAPRPSEKTHRNFNVSREEEL